MNVVCFVCQFQVEYLLWEVNMPLFLAYSGILMNIVFSCITQDRRAGWASALALNFSKTSHMQPSVLLYNYVLA